MHLETDAKLLQNPRGLLHDRKIRITPHKYQYFRIHNFPHLYLNMAGESKPIFAILNWSAVPSTPKPYFTLLLKLIEDASGKYLVGQLTSPILKSAHTIWASI